MLVNYAFLKSPGSELLNIGPISIKWYGFLISLALFFGLFLSKKLAKSRGVNPEYIDKLLPSLVLSSIVGARIYYVIFEFRLFSGNNFFTSIYFLNFNIKLPSFLAIWEGGIAIHGALIGGFISLLIFCKSNKLPLKTILDLIVPSLILGQSIGRWGNFFNNEAFGVPTNSPWKLFIPIQNRPMEFADYEYFHPTFLYESFWNLIIFMIIINIFNKQTKINSVKPGLISCIYLITYSFGRFWIEALRTDPLCLGGYPPFCEGGLKIAQFISIFLFSTGIIWLYNLNSKLNKRRKNG